MRHLTRDVLEAANNAGVVLRVEGDRLLFTAPVGAVTPELRDALKSVKDELVFEYNERCGILEYDADMPRPEAERKAAEMTLHREGQI